MKLMLIGGGNVGRGNAIYDMKEIDEEVVKMCGKDNPNFLFIGLANSFADSYYDYVKKIYKDLGCETVYLKKKNVLNNPDIVKNKIEKADIIYVGGGDTLKLMETLYEYNIDEHIKNAISRDCVVAGVSAGAIMLCKKGFSDSLIIRGESDKYTYVDGLGVVDLSICPHYHSDEKKDNHLVAALKKDKNIVYGLENCAALKIENDKMTVIRSKSGANVYKCNYKDKLIEEVVK